MGVPVLRASPQQHRRDQGDVELVTQEQLWEVTLDCAISGGPEKVSVPGPRDAGSCHRSKNAAFIRSWRRRDEGPRGHSTADFCGMPITPLIQVGRY